MRPFAVVFLAVTFLGAAGSIQSQTKVPKADTQNWNDVQVAVPLTKKVDFIIQGTLRIGDNLTTPVDERWGSDSPIKRMSTSR